MVQHTLLSDDIAHARFACDISRCKGACCVVGDAGAPVSKSEVGVLNKAYSQLKEKISVEARNTVSNKGLVQESADQKLELTCVPQVNVFLCSIPIPESLLVLYKVRFTRVNSTGKSL